MKEKRNNKKTGITLVALVITIVIMLILASVTIGAINGGLFEYAGKAKISTEESSKMEGIKESFILAKSKSKTGKVTTEDLQKALDNIFEKDYAKAIDNSDTIVVKIDEKYYEVDSKGNVAEGRTLASDPNAGDITKGGTLDGSEDHPYEISCIEDLVAFSKNVITSGYYGKYIILTRDLDFNSIFSYSDFTAKYSVNEANTAYVPDEESQTAKSIKELCTTGQGFIPIGGGKTDNYFRGTIDGKNHTISNIYENYFEDSTIPCGLFAAVWRGTVKNLTLDGNFKTYSNRWRISLYNKTEYINKLHQQSKHKTEYRT